jgi:hypothetical protein
MPECNLDTNLVETLVPPEKIGNTCGYNHQYGYGDVINQMKLETMQNKFALGILDIDKDVNYQNRGFQLLIEKHLPSNNLLYLYKHQTNNHYLICHTPIEKWLLNEAKSVNISLTSHNLPIKLKNYTDENGNFMYGLKNIKGTSKNDSRFRGLFNDLIENNSIGIKLLAKWISYLKQHYDADIDITELKKLSQF